LGAPLLERSNVPLLTVGPIACSLLLLVLVIIKEALQLQEAEIIYRRWS
jgi:hypothetical protein